MQMHLMEMKATKVQLCNTSQGGRLYSRFNSIGSKPLELVVRPCWSNTDMQHFHCMPTTHHYYFTCSIF